MKHWFHQLFIAVYQLLNVLVTPLQRGAWADETLSSRACRMDRDGKPCGAHLATGDRRPVLLAGGRSLPPRV